MTYAPVFDPDWYSFDVDEDAAIGTIVGQVQATDPDSQTLSYSLGEDSFGSPFTVDQSTGDIILRRELNYEWSSYEYLSIEVTDTDWNSAYAWVEITINDIDEHPVFDEPYYSFAVAENAAPGTIVGTVAAIDPQHDILDPLGNTPLTYALWMDDDGYGSLAGVKFEIDSFTGEISLQGTLDYERASTINLKAYAYDEDINVTEVTVVVYVANVADDPVFDSGSYQFFIDENEPAPAFLGTVIATDPLDLDITYSLDDGFDNLAFSIDAFTGEITANVSFNYELGSAYHLTAFATNENGVSSSVSVDVTINNIDERPGPNYAPTLSNLTFTVTEQKDGYAIGVLEGTITDDYVAEGHYIIKIDIFNDGTIDIEYLIPQEATGLGFELGIEYGTHDIAVRIDEFELETGSTLIGSWVVINAVVDPPANVAPIIQNLDYPEPIDEGYGFGGLRHFLTGDIVDSTRGNSSYTIQFDMNGDGIVDDSVEVNNDWETFSLEFYPSVGSHTVKVRVIEHDYNIVDSGYGGAGLLVGDWEPLAFTVAPYELENHAPVMNWVKFEEGDPGYGGYVEGEFTDNFGPGGYILEVETTGDTHTKNISSNYFFFDNGSLQPGEEIVRVRIVEQGDNEMATAWIAENIVNQPPVIAPPRTDIKISLRSLEDGTITTETDYLVEDINATDENNDDIEYTFANWILPQQNLGEPIRVGVVWQKKPNNPLSIDKVSGEVKIADPNVLAAFLRRDGKYSFVVRAKDVPGNENAKSDWVVVTIYDNWIVYLNEAETYITAWQEKATNYVTEIYDNSVVAAENLRDFINGKYNNMGFASASTTNLIWGAAAYNKNTKASGTISVAAVLAQILSASYTEKERQGADAIWKAIRLNMLEVKKENITKIEDKAGIATEEGFTGERKKLAKLLASISNDPLDQQALKLRNYIEGLNGLKRSLFTTFSGGEVLEAPSVNDIYGELLIAFDLGASQAATGTPPTVWVSTWGLVGGDNIQKSTGKWWYSSETPFFWLFNGYDVAKELNRIGYIPPDARYIRIFNENITRLPRLK